MRRRLPPRFRQMTMQPPNPTAAKLRTLVNSCLVCSKDLSGHRFAQIATTVATEGNKRRVQELISHVRQHEWAALTRYKDFRPDQNAAVVYSITGPHNGGMVILIRDPFELYERAELYLQEQLGSDELLVVAPLAPAQDWQDL